MQSISAFIKSACFGVIVIIPIVKCGYVCTRWATHSMTAFASLSFIPFSQLPPTKWYLRPINGSASPDRGEKGIFLQEEKSFPLQGVKQLYRAFNRCLR